MTDPVQSTRVNEGSFVSTLGWVGVVMAGALLATLLLSWLGPVGQ